MAIGENLEKSLKIYLLPKYIQFENTNILELERAFNDFSLLSYP